MIQTMLCRSHAIGENPIFVTFPTVRDLFNANKYDLEQVKDCFYVEGVRYKVTWHLHVPCRGEDAIEDRFYEYMRTQVKTPQDAASMARMLDFQNLPRRKKKAVVVERFYTPQEFHAIGLRNRYGESSMCLKSLAEFFSHRLADGTLSSRASRFEAFLREHYEPESVVDFHFVHFESIRGLRLPDRWDAAYIHKYLPAY